MRRHRLLLSTLTSISVIATPVAAQNDNSPTTSDVFDAVLHPSWNLFLMGGAGSQGRFLLQHRDDKPGIANPGMWGSFGGEVEPYETPDDGFLRELREELDWTPASFDLYGAYPYASNTQLIYVFTARIDAALDDLTLGEGQGMAFFAPDALPERTVPDLRRLIERFTTTEAYAAMRSTRPSEH